MDCVTPILEIATSMWHFITKRIIYIHSLNKNLKLLEKEMDGLKKINQDVQTRLAREEEQQMKPTNQVDGWLNRVQILEEEVISILQQGTAEEQKKCFRSFCPRNCRSSYKLGRRVVKMIHDVNKMMIEGHFDVVADKMPRAAVDEMPVDKTVGLSLMFEKVWRSLKDTSVGIIGLYGMGGVGKTTLLKKINNEFLNANHDFDIVIWAVVSRQANMGKVQRVIRNKLEIADHIWRNKNEDERAAEIFRVMRRKKFLLLLDDVWERFDLCKIGVPLPDDRNESKVIFTARSEEVCGQMEAHKRFRVECLTREEAMDLFLSKVGEDTLNSHPDIPRLAKVVAEECKGLPLALITVGRAMASRKNPQEWEHAIEVLKSYPSKFRGMVDYVYLLLEFSYDSLHDSTLQSCFLYCSMFPEDYNIRKKDLIELWIGEGFLDEFDNIHEARNQGEYIIGSLKLACLLEGDKTEEYVRMHDVIRDMALWLASERSGKNKILVYERAQLCESHRASKWKEAERISLWGHNITDLTYAPICHNIVTMLVRETRLKLIPCAFFQSISTLGVLDLSGNHDLIELPMSICGLVNLQYLNLSVTAIRELPVELKNLTKLRFLLLNSTDHLMKIPRGIISSLVLLQVFSKLPNQLNLSLGQNYDDTALLEELDCLEHLDDLCFTTSNAHSVKKLLNSPKLQRCTRNLSLVRCSGLTLLNISSSSLRQMKRVEKLTIYHCNSLTELKVHLEEEGRIGQPAHDHVPNNANFARHEYFCNLRHLYVGSCPLLELNWIIHAPSLQTLTLVDCDSMEEVVADDFGAAQNPDMFSSLTILELIRLPKLKRIYPGALPFPSLTQIRVNRCQSLLRLPFDSNSSKNLKQIVGERSWWGVLQWEDEATKLVFSSKFIST